MSPYYSQNPGDSDYYRDEQKRRRVLIGVGYAGVFVLGGLVGALLVGRPGAPKKEAAPTAATAATAITKAPTPAPTVATAATPLTAATVAKEPVPPPEKDVVAFVPPKREPVVRPAEVPKAPKTPATKEGGKGLAPEQIKGTIDKRLGGIQAEYNAELKKNLRLGGGKVSVRFTIAPSGNVTSAEVAEDTIGNAALTAGILRRVRTWQFPRASGETKVVYPFVFVSSGV